MFTKANDRVLIIGGGQGISGLYASKKAFNGKVEIYEAGYGSYARILNYNEIRQQSNLSVKQYLVGEDINVYGGSTETAKNIRPQDLGYYDVIELDCEGSEYDILDKLNELPRNIICEFHPIKNIDYSSYLLKLLKKYNLVLVTDNSHNKIEFEIGIKDLIENKIVHMFFERKKD